MERFKVGEVVKVNVGLGGDTAQWRDGIVMKQVRCPRDGYSWYTVLYEYGNHTPIGVFGDARLIHRFSE